MVDMEIPTRPGIVYMFFKSIGDRYQNFIDKTTRHLTARWTFLVVIVLAYLIRVYFIQGWYIITYALGIYLLNLFIAFLTPQIDPAIMDDTEDGPSLPTKVNEEFKPFMRRLQEFKFWYSASRAIVIATICTFFDVFNIPVFWPILVMYFIILFTVTMKRQIKHMIKYRYIPLSFGKAKYRGKEDTGKVSDVASDSVSAEEVTEMVTKATLKQFLHPGEGISRFP